MRSWSRRLNRLVGAVSMATLLAGGCWLSGSGPAAAETPPAVDARSDYDRGLQLFHSGRYADALPFFVTAKEDALDRYGGRSSEYATALNNLAELYRLMGRLDEAEPLFRDALAIEEERLGPNDPGLARPLNNLALLYRVQGRYEEAERNLKRSLALLEDTLGNRHPDVAGSFNNLARLYETMGLEERALPLLERALMIAEDTLGPTHPSTQQIRSNLERVSAAAGEAPAARDDTLTAAVEPAEAGPARALDPPAELVLPPREPPAAPAATAPGSTAVAAPLVLVPEAETPPPAPPPPLARPLVPAPAAVVAAAPLPDVEIVHPEPAAGPEPGELAAVSPNERTVADAPAGPTTASNGEIEIALLAPFPASRPSGRRWAKLPADRYAIHLASVRSPISASEEFERLRDVLELPGEVGQLEPERIEVAEQGVFYRVLGGPFASRAEANAVCRPIRDSGDFCAVLGAERGNGD